MSLEGLISRIDKLVGLAWDTGYYAGILESTGLTADQKKEYQRLSRDAIDDRNKLKRELVDYIRASR